MELINKICRPDRPLSIGPVNINHYLARGFSALLVIIPPLELSETLAEGVDVKPQIIITVASF